MVKRIVGSGKHVWEVISPFGRMPDGQALGACSAVAVDSKDRVYVLQRSDPPVRVFDTEGNLLSSWGVGEITEGHGIYVSPQDEVFVTDKDGHDVLKFTTGGKLLMRLGKRDRPAFQAPFNHPADVAVSKMGDIFVADGYGNSNVHRFTAKGKHVQSWGVPGAKPGEFTTPHGIWVDSKDRVMVADRENNRLQLFSVEGDLLEIWPDLFHPMDIYVDKEGFVYVTD
ncbi:MAG: 6-bladed beta-propeller, partial [SAR202 cluster bacterium]|nr:6-bladed beta-propeller [SAR202 cluster bacterium]